MNKLSLIVLLFIFNATLFAQAPEKFNFQGVVRNQTGSPLSNQPIQVKISILDVSPSGNVLYQEKHTTTTNNFGLYNLAIGTGTLLAGNFSLINWALNDKYILTELSTNNGVSFNTLGSTQLLSVPYSLYAANAPFTNFQVFDATSIFNVPANVKKVMVECWGAGGGGGDYIVNGPQGNYTLQVCGGGGGYGKSILNVTPSMPILVTVGLGGLPNQNGGTSSFGTLLSSTGGGTLFCSGCPIPTFAFYSPGGTSNGQINIDGGHGYQLGNGGTGYSGSSPLGGGSIRTGNGIKPGGGGAPTSNGANGRVIVWY